MKKLQNLSLLLSSTILTLFVISCNDNKIDNQETTKDSQEKKVYNLIIGIDTIPINLQKKLQNGFYRLDTNMNLTYVQSKNDEPADPVVVGTEHDLFKTQYPHTTYAVNFLPEDIGGFANIVDKAATYDHRTVDSFRIKFIVYNQVPTIRGVQRQDYMGKVSVALFAMSNGMEYTVSTMPGADLRPRNLGTICPVCP